MYGRSFRSSSGRRCRLGARFVPREGYGDARAGSMGGLVRRLRSAGTAPRSSGTQAATATRKATASATAHRATGSDSSKRSHATATSAGSNAPAASPCTPSPMRSGSPPRAAGAVTHSSPERRRHRTLRRRLPRPRRALPDHRRHVEPATCAAVARPGSWLGDDPSEIVMLARKASGVPKEVELAGLEPAASWVRSRRSPS
jgi:hypothetical protein